VNVKALITGINGQDGSYLAEILLSHGYEVHGTARRSSVPNLWRLAGITDRITLHYADLTDASSISRLVADLKPDELYNLAAMSDVRASFDTPLYAGTATGLGVLAVIEAVRQFSPRTKVYQAGSSEMFGTNPVVPFDESSTFAPASPYAAAKVYGYHTARNYRDAFGLFITNGILFNHESPRRGEEFVTRKITRGVNAILAGRADTLVLGNLRAYRDWGWAPEYMEAAYRMMRRGEPSDYVIATGEAHSVEEFAERAFAWAGLDWHEHVEFSADLLRPSEVTYLLGDASRAAHELGWQPEITFDRIVELMMEADQCE
jgi:GDPmannose 4,6-dehydratase